VAIALEELGYPTFHTILMYAYENEEILKMWSERVVEPAIAKLDPVIGRADLKLIADSGYQAVADMPSILYFEQILEEYPDCKFVLTTRENSEVWYRSWESLTKSVTTSMHLGGILFPTVRLYSRYLRWAYAFVNKDTSYMTSFFPKDDNIKENAIATYEEHNRRVREVIPPDQLLEFNVKDGWDPLCQFLEVEECPTTPFPKSNSGGQMRAQSYSAVVVGIIVLFFVIRSAWKSFAKKEKKKIA
jgi:Sulfotransferase domain